MRGGRHFGAIALALLLGAGSAQARPLGDVAVPFYTPGHFVQGLYRHHSAPLAAVFAQRANALAPALRALCEASPSAAAPALRAARAQWVAAAGSWERLAAVAIGPLLERRSARAIDFMPARPALIERAVRTAPADAAAMVRIGAPAKGFPALEWLLWTQPVQPATPACAYAGQVAHDIAREAAALDRGFADAAGREWDGEAAATAMGEALNQWLAGLSRLRWQGMERPLQAAADAGGAAPEYPRVASGATAESWAAQWAGLRVLAVLPADDAAPRPGTGLVPFETYLRGRGLNPAADALVQAVQQADAALRRLTPDEPARVKAAAAALAALRRVVEADVAPALEIGIGFSDADGD